MGLQPPALTRERPTQPWEMNTGEERLGGPKPSQMASGSAAFKVARKVARSMSVIDLFHNPLSRRCSTPIPVCACLALCRGNTGDTED